MRLALLTLLAVSTSLAQAQPTTDPSFAGGGLAEFPRPHGVHVISEPDGSSTLVSTWQSGYGGVPPETSLTRLAPDGSVDASFAPVTQTGIHTFAIIRLADGRYAVAGRSGSPGNDQPAVVAVLLPDGRLDASFGTGGIVTLDWASPRETFLEALVEQAGGFVVVGRSGLTGIAARYSAAGHLDATFGEGGIVRVIESPLQDVALRPDGGLLVVGRAFDMLSSRYGTLFLRLTAQGETEPAFGTVIRHASPASVGSSWAYVAMRPDGSAVVSASVYLSPEPNTGSETAVFVTRADGGTDDGFGQGGSVVVDAFPTTPGLPNSGGDSARRAVVLPDGRVYVAVSAYDSAGGLAVVGLAADGTPADGAPGAIARFYTESGFFRLMSVSPLPDGRFMISGANGDPREGGGPSVVGRLVPPRSTAELPTQTAPAGLAVAPNPARGAAAVTLRLAESAAARVTVLDALGRTVAVLHDGPLAAGETTLALDAAGLPAGVYAVGAQVGSERMVRRVTVVR